MKKFILPAVALFFALASCKKEVTKVVRDEAQSVVYRIMPEDWVANDDNTIYYASFDMPELTQAIFDHGAVLVYCSFVDGDYEMLPQVFNYNNFRPIHYVGGVDIEIRDIDGKQVTPPDVEVWAKVILIDAEKLAMHPNVDLTDYKEVKQVFQVRD